MNLRLWTPGILALAIALAGCGDPATETSRTESVPAAERPAPVFGSGPRYRLPPAGPLVSESKPVGRLGCTRVKRDRYGTHLEVFARRRDLVISAGIGIAPPLRRDGAYVRGGRCWYPARTIEPTGLIEIDEGVDVTLGEFFDLWGQPLSRKRLLSFRAPRGDTVSAFVDGKRWRGDIRSLPLRRHAAIVLEVDGYFPPTPRYEFPPGL
jgi:hypothetical protein